MLGLTCNTRCLIQTFKFNTYKQYHTKNGDVIDSYLFPSRIQKYTIFTIINLGYLTSKLILCKNNDIYLTRSHFRYYNWILLEIVTWWSKTDLYQKKLLTTVKTDGKAQCFKALSSLQYFIKIYLQPISVEPRNLYPCQYYYTY